MTEAAKEIMGIETISVVADKGILRIQAKFKGYYDATDISNCEQSGTTCYVAVVDSYSHAPDPKYDCKNFRYDAENDCYICPENISLSLAKTRRSDGENPQGVSKRKRLQVLPEQSQMHKGEKSGAHDCPDSGAGPPR
jgi:hypothetical protein